MKESAISSLLAWITVEKNEVVLEISLSDKESPLEVFAKIAPLVVSQMRF